LNNGNHRFDFIEKETPRIVRNYELIGVEDLNPQKYLKLSDRKRTCPHCGAEHSRDKNAAVNIKQESKRLLTANQELSKKSMENHLGVVGTN
jgi:transposase